MPVYILTTEIILLSQSQIWDEAKLEWELIDIRDEECQQECLCGHYPIREVCTIQNRSTKKTAELGNCCVKKFDQGMHKIVPSVKKLRNKADSSVNAETIDYAFKKKLLSFWERGFYLDILRKRNLSIKQLDKKRMINGKILKIISSN